MGYNVNTRGVNFTIPADKLEAATEALNKHKGNDEMETAEEILREIGFKECEITATGDLELNWYQGKSHDEEEYLVALAPFVPAGSYVNWEGEDGQHWQDYFDGEGGHEQKSGYVVYS